MLGGWGGLGGTENLSAIAVHMIALIRALTGDDPVIPHFSICPC